MKNQYSNLKAIFIDSPKIDYIKLDKSVLAYEKLVQSINKPLKLILFFGKPGTGKTFLLQKLFNDFSGKKRIVFLPRPFFEEKAFIAFLYEAIFKKKSPDFLNYNDFLTFLSKYVASQEESITVLIDEAQLYPIELIEKIRLMSDSRLLKFVFTVHKTDKEDILAKDYFKTRIWEVIELENASYSEMKIYIEKKFLANNCFDFVSLLKEYHYKVIYKYTNGNLRSINKLLFKFFEILEYYHEFQPSKVSHTSVRLKYVIMSALSLGVENA